MRQDRRQRESDCKREEEKVRLEKQKREEERKRNLGANKTTLHFNTILECIDLQCLTNISGEINVQARRRNDAFCQQH